MAACRREHGLMWRGMPATFAIRETVQCAVIGMVAGLLALACQMQHLVASMGPGVVLDPDGCGFDALSALTSSR